MTHMPIAPPEPAGARSGNDGWPRLVDADIHHGPLSLGELAPYLSQTYRTRLLDYGLGGLGSGYSENGGLRGWRADVLADEVPQRPPAGGPVAWDLAAVQRQLLDECGVDVAVLTGATVYRTSSMPDLDYASALCRAFNEWTRDQWLEPEPRLRFCMSICTQDPAGAVAEIDRFGPDPRVVAVLMPSGALRPFGHRFYHPIYEACVRNDLAVAVHFGSEGGGINPPISAAGFPTYYIESRLLRPSFYQVHLASFVFEGVFVRFPTLRVAMLESGFTWLPAYLWRMDLDWKGLRRQTPWVDRLPSEYVVEHVRLASQPLDEPEEPGALDALLRWSTAERTLMFASDYPHWDWDDPRQVFKGLRGRLRRRIFAENAAEVFGLVRAAVP